MWLQSISYRSLGLSLLIDWSAGAAAPFCKVCHIITQEEEKIILSTNKKSYTYLYTHRRHLDSGDLLRAERKKYSKVFERILSR